VYGFCLFATPQQPPVGQGLHFIEDSRSHSDIPQSVGRGISSSQRLLPDNTQSSQKTSMSPVGFEPRVPASKRPYSHSLDRATTGIGVVYGRFVLLFSTVLSQIRWYTLNCVTSLVVWWSVSLTTNHEVPGSIPGSTVGIFPERKDSRGDHGLGALAEFRFKGPPGTTSSYITTHIIGTM